MTQPITSPESNRILRASIWVAIGALIAAALVCVVWVLIGDENGIVGKAFMTILLLAGFAGVAILEANLAPRRPAWFALTSMVSWVLILLIGAFMIWMPTTGYYGIGAERFFKFLVIVLIIQAAVLHVRLFIKAYERHQTTFTTIVAYVTIGLVVILAIMLVLPIMTEEFIDYRALYWRVVVALAILAAVGTALLPLVNALFAPKKPRPVAPAAYYSPAPVATQWPTFAYPQPAGALPADAAAAAPAAAGPAAAPAAQPAQATPPVAPGYQGYPPAPPAPPVPPQQ